MIGSAISSFEYHNEAGVTGGVWVSDIEHLYINLETPMALDPSMFTYTSLEGMALLCQVRPLADLIKRDTVNFMVIQDTYFAYSRL